MKVRNIRGGPKRLAQWWMGCLKHPAVQNFGWLLADRGIRLAIAVLIGSWVARYLGPEDFGLFSFGTALATIFSVLSTLAMEPMAVRRIIQEPESAGRWIGSVWGCRLMASGCFLVPMALVTYGARPLDPRAIPLVVILALGVMAQSLEAGELWFQAQTRMRRVVLPRLVVFLVMNSAKVFLILSGTGILAFAVLTALEQVLCGIVTRILLVRHGGPNARPIFSSSHALTLIQESWPLLISLAALTIYMRLGQVLLALLVDDAVIGTYAAGARIPDATLFLPSILTSSFLPWLMQARSRGPTEYYWARVRLFRLSLLMGGGLSLLLSITAPWIVRVLYGAAYRDSVAVLAVYAWTLLPLFLNNVRGQYLLNEKLTHYPPAFSILGLAANVALMFLLVPRFFALGAAIATVASHFVSWLAPVALPSLRFLIREQFEALLPKRRIA